MGAGLQIFNVNGFLQVDENYSNYAFDRKVTIRGESIDAPGTLYYGYYYTVKTGVDDCICFRGQADCPVSLIATDISGDVTTHTFCTSFGYRGDPVVDFYIFSVNKPPFPSSGGVEIYSEAGKLVFSSDSFYMNPVGVWSGASYPSIFDSAMPAGDKYAILVEDSSDVAIMQGGPSGAFYTTAFSDGSAEWVVDEDVFSLGFSNIGGSLRVVDQRVGGRSYNQRWTQPTPINYQFHAYYIMAVDVSRFK